MIILIAIVRFSHTNLLRMGMKRLKYMKKMMIFLLNPTLRGVQRDSHTFSPLLFLDFPHIHFIFIKCYFLRTYTIKDIIKLISCESTSKLPRESLLFLCVFASLRKLSLRLVNHTLCVSGRNSLRVEECLRAHIEQLIVS